MRKHPDRHLERMEERGADELMNVANWVLRDKPRALARARDVYRLCCRNLERLIEQAQR